MRAYAKPDEVLYKGMMSRLIGMGSGKNGRGRVSHKAQLRAWRKTVKSAARFEARRAIQEEVASGVV